jgi:preprotein translocase subunit SecE
VPRAHVGVKKQPFVLVRLMRETVAELRKVNWPTRREAVNLTMIVLITLGVMSAILGLADALFAEFFRLILSLAR